MKMIITGPSRRGTKEPQNNTGRVTSGTFFMSLRFSRNKSGNVYEDKSLLILYLKNLECRSWFSAFAMELHLCAFSSPEAAILLVSTENHDLWPSPLAQPLARSNSGSPRFTDFPLLCACSESSLPNLIGSGLNLLCLQGHSKPECRWTWPEVVIFSADQKDRGLWGREWKRATKKMFYFSRTCADKSPLCWIHSIKPWLNNITVIKQTTLRR